MKNDNAPVKSRGAVYILEGHKERMISMIRTAAQDRMQVSMTMVDAMMKSLV
jgi:hypothetical protein